MTMYWHVILNEAYVILNEAYVILNSDSGPKVKQK